MPALCEWNLNFKKGSKHSDLVYVVSRALSTGFWRKMICGSGFYAA